MNDRLEFLFRLVVAFLPYPIFYAIFGASRLYILLVMVITAVWVPLFLIITSPTERKARSEISDAEMRKQEDEAGCFIATASYGTENHPDIDVLRKFRDEVMREDKLLSFVVEVYYIISPPIAGFISDKSKIKRIVRDKIVKTLVSICS